MRYRQFGMPLLLGLLLILSSLIAALHAQPPGDDLIISKEDFAQTKPVADGIASMPISDIINLLLPYIRSESIEQIVAELQTISPEHVEVARSIIKRMLDATLLSRDNIVLVTLGIADNFKDDPQAQQKIFSLFVEKPTLLQGLPPVYVAANSIFSAVAPAFIAWAGEQPTLKSQINLFINKAYEHAVVTRNVRALRNMIDQNITVSPQQLSTFLWQSASDSKAVALVRFLLKQGADPAYHKDGVTVLMRAVRSLNLKIVQEITQALIEAGSDLNVVVKDEVGSILQDIADFERNEISGDGKKNQKKLDKLHDIEDYLRENGAQSKL